MASELTAWFEGLDVDQIGDSSAVICAGGRLSYRQLVEAVDRRSAELALPDRSLVILAGPNSLDWVVTYLALLRDGHVPLLAGDHVDRLSDGWRPNAIVFVSADGFTIDRCGSEAVELHPDLALLMSTSGSTGSPKLVRLSGANLLANAASIAQFQSLTPQDRAITSLPLHYSFGLSVLNSHLFVGASVVVTDASVVDPCFVRAMSECGVTNLAGVPHTFDLLDRAGPERIRVDTLRFLAQAGGRMDPATTSTWAARARAWGAEWFTMYGQTEATARIAFVPPALAGRCSGAIGQPIPGGSIRLDSIGVEQAGVGEIVYEGPNVMLGYATERCDLALGPTVNELRTGDLGRFDANTGLLQIVGRRSRIVKPFGLRIDLDDLEHRVGSMIGTCAIAGDDEIVVASTHADEALVAAALAELTGLPVGRVHIVVGDLPFTESGKIDYRTLLDRGRQLHADRDAEQAASTAVTGDGRLVALQHCFAAVLGRDEVRPTDSFVSLGGDSLSYVECSIRLESLLGQVPEDWHLCPLADLAAAETAPRRFARLDTTVVLRAVGILAVVSTHMRFRHVPGGAHLMLGIVGYNLGRFMMPIESTRERVAAGARTVARVAVPTVAWTALLMLAGQYTWTTLTLVNNYIGPRSHAGNHWHFWFIEVFVHLVLITTVLFAIPAVRRLDRRLPYAFPLAVLAGAITLRMEWADLGDWYNLRFRTHAVAWFFVLGWLVQRSGHLHQRLLTTIICLVSAPGVFDNPRREYFIALGLVLLVWVKEIPVPRFAVRPIAVVASASMWIMISHFMIWPPLKSVFIIEVAYALTVLGSIGVSLLMTNLSSALTKLVPLARRQTDATPRWRPGVQLSTISSIPSTISST